MTTKRKALNDVAMNTAEETKRPNILVHLITMYLMSVIRAEQGKQNPKLTGKHRKTGTSRTWSNLMKLPVQSRLLQSDVA